MGKKVRVGRGDCLASIAFEHGFFPDTLWRLDENRALSELREDPYVLAPGDEVFVPEPRPRQAPIITGARHVFRRRGVPERFQLRLLDALDQPRAGLEYRFTVIGEERKGSTDGEGWIREWIPPDAETALLQLPEDESHRISLGRLAPISTARGVRQRLRNLRYPVGEETGEELGAVSLEALRRCLVDRGVEVAEALEGEALESARRELREAHGS